MEGKEMEKREEDVSQSAAATSAPCGWHVGHTGLEGCSGRGSHGLHTWWQMHANLLRAPSRSSAVSWASELRF